MNLILLGPPGSGKGTQALFLHHKLGIPAISTGDIFRFHSRNKTPLGIKAEQYISKGQLVPDDVVVTIVQSRLAEKDCVEGYILDGFPRTLPQAHAFTKILHEKNSHVDGVINLHVDDEEVVKRISGRRLCKKCGASYHLIFAPPKKEGLCDRCGGELYLREDDQEETIQKRLNVYREQTAPLIEYYGREGILKDICGTGDTAQVSIRISQKLGYGELTLNDYPQIER